MYCASSKRPKMTIFWFDLNAKGLLSVGCMISRHPESIIDALRLLQFNSQENKTKKNLMYVAIQLQPQILIK